MATTSAQLIAWLKSDTAKRCVLIRVGVQIGGIETIRYLSNKNFSTYQPVIAGGVSFSESLSLDGSVSISNGAIDFHNINGEIDSWLDDVWKNRKIDILIGDEFWAESDFYLIFSGVIAEQPTASDRMKITLTLADKLQRLNTTVSDVKLGGTTPNADKLIPLLFGECFNISPLLVDNAIHQYRIHNGPVERIIEVRDNGIPVGFTANLSMGTFVLTQQPAGTITCDAQGDNFGGYVNDAAGLIRKLVKNYGTIANRFTDAELYLTADLTANLPGDGSRTLDTQMGGNIVLEQQTTQGAAVSGYAALGEYVTEKTNLLELCNKIASSIGARVAMTRTGILYIVRLQLPQPSTGTQVSAANIRERTLTAETVPVVASQKLGYCKNYTVQTTVADGVPADQQNLFNQEWPFTSTWTDNLAADKYKLILNPDTVATSLQAKEDADLETQRRGALFGTQRRIYSYEGTPELLVESLGSPQFLQHPRFGLQSGTTGQLVRINSDFLAAKINIGILA
jgi:hypothetical protein